MVNSEQSIQERLQWEQVVWDLAYLESIISLFPAPYGKEATFKIFNYFQLAQRLVENCLDLFIQHKIYDNCSQYAVEKYMSELDDEAMNNRRLAKYVLSHASIMIDPTRYSEELPVINNMITSLDHIIDGTDPAVKTENEPEMDEDILWKPASPIVEQAESERSKHDFYDPSDLSDLRTWKRRLSIDEFREATNSTLPELASVFPSLYLVIDTNIWINEFENGVESPIDGLLASLQQYKSNIPFQIYLVIPSIVVIELRGISRQDIIEERVDSTQVRFINPQQGGYVKRGSHLEKMMIRARGAQNSLALLDSIRNGGLVVLQAFLGKSVQFSFIDDVNATDLFNVYSTRTIKMGANYHKKQPQYEWDTSDVAPMCKIHNNDHILFHVCLAISARLHEVHDILDSDTTPSTSMKPLVLLLTEDTRARIQCKELGVNAVNLEVFRRWIGLDTTLKVIKGEQNQSSNATPKMKILSKKEQIITFDDLLVKPQASKQGIADCKLSMNDLFGSLPKNQKENKITMEDLVKSMRY